jgi:hypothetical protein
MKSCAQTTGETCRATLLRLALPLALAGSLHAGFFYNGTSPAAPPWPGGVVPYVIDPALAIPALTDPVAAKRVRAYLDGIREWELAGNVHFIPRTTETDYVFLKYNSNGPNRVSGSQPQIVEINSLTRGQICHEMGHSLGLNHEHIRPDRGDFINVLSTNISAGNVFWFDIDPNGVSNGNYDFESVMHFGRNLFSVDPNLLDTLSPKSGFERYQVRMGNFAISPGDRAAITWLYGAAALAAVVTTTADAGAGSLRAALYHATDHPGTPVTFNIPTSDPGYSGGVFTIRSTGHLPPLVTNGMTVDATTQPGYAGSPLVFIDGSDILSESGDPPGMMIYAANCTVKGLAFTRARWVGVAILHPDATGNQICSCWSGLGPDGNAAQANIKQGIQVSGGAHGNTIGPDNVLSGNTEYGIWMSGPSTSGNIVRGNRIGTNSAGAAARANGLGGVIVTDGSHDNVIGGGNVISGNNNAGIRLTGTGVDDNTVSGNSLGTNAAGTAAIPNSFVGLYVLDGAAGNTVSGNVIAGNAVNFGYGMVIGDPESDGNLVDGNLIGVLRNGAPLPNAFAGLAIWGGARDNVVSGNLIRHQSSYGIALYDKETFGNKFSANSISDNGIGIIGIGPANHAQAAPSLSSAVAGAAGIDLAGSLTSTASATFRIEFFSNAAPGVGNGRTFIGALDDVDTDGSGLANINVSLQVAVLAGRTITATATNTATDDTSEFSYPLTVSTTDTDNDGMPNAYETARGLNAAVNDAALDADGDGFSNLAEYLAGTDPRGGADFFKALSVTRMGNDLSVKFRVVPGRAYRIEESTSLAGESWTILVPVRHAASSELEVIVPISAGKGFYRALLLE